MGNNSSISVILSLINAYCLPILTYVIDALKWSKSMYNQLENAYSSVYSKIFATYDKDVIKQCQYYCGYMQLCDIIDTRAITFWVKWNSRITCTYQYFTTHLLYMICDYYLQNTELT